VEESVQKQQQDKVLQEQLEAQLKESEGHKLAITGERDQLKRDKDNLEDLVRQAQGNIRQMRDEKEYMNGQIA
jgi:hypothetical protein